MVDRHHPGKAPTALLQMLADGGCLTTEEVEARIDLTRRQISMQRHVCIAAAICSGLAPAAIS